MRVSPRSTPREPVANEALGRKPVLPDTIPAIKPYGSRSVAAEAASRLALLTKK
jgi:hypothetical protein